MVCVCVCVSMLTYGTHVHGINKGNVLYKFSIYVSVKLECNLKLILLSNAFVCKRLWD